MVKDEKNKDGLFWTPLGGNNIDDFSGNCHYDKDGNAQNDAIIVDIGIYDNHKSAAGGEKSEAAVPDVRSLLKEKKAKAVLLTHAHIDHIGGISEYVKMGYEMPPIYAGKFTKEMLKRSFADKKIPYNKIHKHLSLQITFYLFFNI